MFNSLSRVLVIAQKDLLYARRDAFFLLLTLFIATSALIAVLTGSIALATDVATYNDAKETLLALGKSLNSIAAPEFYPLKLLRGAIEQIEILGAVVGILVGFRTVIAERGNQVLALILTRPIARHEFIAGKVLAGFGLISLSLFLVFSLLTAVLALSSGVGISVDDLIRILITWGLASVYVGGFFLLSFALCIKFKRSSNALLASFIIWLLIVLIAPQVGDTLDPDNQVAGGVFKQLHIPKAEQNRIKASYATYETMRNGIEVSSITKHFERVSFAVLGIKDTYTGKKLQPILAEKRSDIFWIVLFFLSLILVVFTQKINFQQLTKE